MDKSGLNGSIGSELIVDLGAVVANWRHLSQCAGGAECAAAVKANAYGLGMVEVASALWATGCKTFFVAHVQEGETLRASLPQARIFVLNGFLPGTIEAYRTHRLAPILGSRLEVDDWLSHVSNGGPFERPALHVDTGMNRLGFRVEDFKSFAAERALLETLQPQLLMSHFACADEPSHPLNDQQSAAFGEIAALLPDVPRSLANSAAILSQTGLEFDMVRPGVALYGGRPHPKRSSAIRDVVTVRAQIIQVRSVKAGETISYGATYKPQSDHKVAILCLGYADGLHRIAGSSDAHPGHICFIADHPAPVLGRVTMDLVAIDVTDIPEPLAQRGTFVEVLGPNASLENAARCYQTIDYEVLTSLGQRLSRKYINGPSA